MVSVDGWIRLMNEHPAFDGIEFEYTVDGKGGTTAIEAIIHRSDRKHPIKVMELMSECKGTTGPWSKSPSRMLRHRALIQGVRVAFGFSGIHAEGDEEVVEAQYREVQPLPNRQSLAEELNDEIPAFDKQTGEIREEPARNPATGMTEVSEEAARELDAGNDGTLSDDNPTAAEGPADEQRGEAEAPVWQAKYDELVSGLRNAGTPAAIKAVEAEYVKHCIGFPQEVANDFEALLAEKKKSTTEKGN
jgi:RecT family